MSAADPTKRALMTIGDSSEVLKKPDKSAGTGSEKSKTLRFDLELFEPDEYKFPEFNYKKLVHIEKVYWTKKFSSSYSRDCEKKKKEKRNHFFRFTLSRLAIVLLTHICQRALACTT